MAVETERIFLVIGEFRLLAVSRKEIVQLTFQLFTRVGKVELVDHKAFITIKGVIEASR
jgi:CYTH domain-containing protein